MNARFRDGDDSRLEQWRVPPQSIEAEQAVLGGLMLAPDALMRITDWVRPEDFYRRDHQLIYRAICELAEKPSPYDAVTLGEWFEAQGLAQSVIRISASGASINPPSTACSASMDCGGTRHCSNRLSSSRKRAFMTRAPCGPSPPRRFW